MWTKAREWYNRLMITSEPRDDWEEIPPLFEFVPWDKTPRLFRDIVITEKIDGTNAAVIIEPVGWEPAGNPDVIVNVYRPEDDQYYAVGAQSRNRVITTDQDNQGFARWVLDHAADLVDDLGPGRHFGEFWGGGIMRKYGLPKDERRFSLFNPVTQFRTWGARSGSPEPYTSAITPGLGVVPVLYEGPFDTEAIRVTLVDLQANGSFAAPGFMRPEGIVVYHTHARRIIGKVTLDGHDRGKWEALPNA